MSAPVELSHRDKSIIIAGLMTGLLLAALGQAVVGIVSAATIRELPLRDHIDVRDTTSIAELA